MDKYKGWDVTVERVSTPAGSIFYHYEATKGGIRDIGDVDTRHANCMFEAENFVKDIIDKSEKSNTGKHDIKKQDSEYKALQEDLRLAYKRGDKHMVAEIQDRIDGLYG